MFKTTIDMFKTNNFANPGGGGVCCVGAYKCRTIYK